MFRGNRGVPRSGAERASGGGGEAGVDDQDASGSVLLCRGDVAGAVRRLGEELAASPERAPLHHDLALAHRLRGDLARARHHVREALARAATAPTLALAASIETLSGEPAAADALLGEALARDPDHVPSLHQSAVAAAQRGDRALGLERLRRVAALPLPPLVRARVSGQIHDLLGGGEVAPACLARAPLWTEIQGIVPTSPVASDAEPAPPAQLGRPIDVAEARAAIAAASRIVALTGAGLSVGSGLLTRKELWQRFDRDDAVTATGFARDPRALWTVVRAFLGDADPTPSAAHLALARMRGLGAIITQNVDGLHQAAQRAVGNTAPVIELHGALDRVRCHDCGRRHPEGSRALAQRSLPARCSCGGALRPDVVLFGERVDAGRLRHAEALSARCDLLLVIGTAADVAPAAALPAIAAARGAAVIELKHRPSRLHHLLGTRHLAGSADALLPQLVEP
jgi:NAD-dependent deacetylase